MKFTHLSQMLHTPLAIAESYVPILRSQAALPNVDIKAYLDTLSTRQEESTLTKGDIPIVRVFGCMSAKDDWWGDTSYEGVTRRLSNLVASEHKEILLYVDSPGGEVSGLFALAEYIHGLKAKGVNVTAFTDGSATSAAYVIASAAKKVYATQTANLASIGVIMTLVSVAKAEKEAGIDYTILRSKDEKALANIHEPTSKVVIDNATKVLGTLDAIMNTSVNKFRPKVTLDTIDTLEGRAIFAEEALDLGLIDKVVSSLDEVLTMITKASAKTLPTTVNKGNTMTHEEALAKVVALQSELETMKASTSLEVAKAKQNEQGRVLGIIEAGTTFKLSNETIVKRIKANSTIEDAVSMFEEIKEALQAKESVDISGAGNTSTKPPALNTDGKEPTFLEGFMSGVDKVAASSKLFEGVK
jgi:ClpP class serine protease